MRFDPIFARPMFMILLVEIFTRVLAADSFCSRSRLFSMKAQDAALTSHVMAVHQVASELECGQQCLRRSKCLSFNYENNNTTSAHECEVNDDTKERNPDDFVMRDGFSYFEAEPKVLPCSVRPCQNGAACEEECDGRYKCICPTGYTGMHCEDSISFNATSCVDDPCKNNGSCMNMSYGYNCTCQTGFNGINCEHAESCLILRNLGVTSDGVYSIVLPSLGRVPVFCDQSTRGGGWTVIQRRYKPFTLQFDRDWAEYEDGFGDLTGEFWLGNKIIHNLTDNLREVLIELQSSGGVHGYAVYSHFSVKGPDVKYRLEVYGYQGNISDCAGDSSWQKFTTRDSDNDEDNSQNCGVVEQAGWWYKNCGQCGNLNRQQKPKWENWIGKDDIEASKMMIR